MSRLGVFVIQLFTTLFFSVGLLGGEGQIAKANNIDIWYETFGQKANPPLLLIMGACSQGILWPTEFCEQLANEGFYVIRYDHRDAGYSTCFNFEKNPYDLLDMAKDAIGLLDYLGIEKTHLCGLSMGGPIAELMSVHFPERVLSLALMATSSDFRPLHLALDGHSSKEDLLSGPKEHYLRFMVQFIQSIPKNDEEKLEQRLEGWRMLNGSAVPLEEKSNRELQKEFLSRVRHFECITNHILANKLSEELIYSVPHEVKVPTVIFLGTEDPIFSSDHGEALAKAIKGSTYVCVKGMGHVPNCKFNSVLIEAIKRNANSHF